jgi:hypothetical protein
VARDWYTAASEWLPKYLSGRSPWVQALMHEAQQALELPGQWPPSDWTVGDDIEVYTRLIDRFPQTPWLYNRRAVCFARQRAWQQAVDDYASAIELYPDTYHYHDRAVICLYLGDTVEYRRMCEQAFELNLGFRMHGGGARVIRMCALTPVMPVDQDDLSAFVHLVPECGDDLITWARVACGMLDYRCGRFQTVLERMPPHEEPFQASLSLLYSAMAFQRLGHLEQATLLLEKARHRIDQELPTPDGPELAPGYHVPDRPVAWCMLQVVLREAESVIGQPGRSSSASGGPADRKE